MLTITGIFEKLRNWFVLFVLGLIVSKNIAQSKENRSYLKTADEDNNNNIERIWTEVNHQKRWRDDERKIVYLCKINRQKRKKRKTNIDRRQGQVFPRCAKDELTGSVQKCWEMPTLREKEQNKKETWLDRDYESTKNDYRNALTMADGQNGQR